MYNSLCYSCYYSDHERPYWDEENKNKKCLSCKDAFDDGRDFWDPNTQTCVSSCPDVVGRLPARLECRECDDINPKTPYWDDEKEECTACPSDNPRFD